MAFHGFHAIARCVFVIREEDSSDTYEQLVLLFNAVGMFFVWFFKFNSKKQANW